METTSNLVVVRVVVRDGQGKPVKGLKKEDFHIFDRGKEQTISQFEEEAPLAETTIPSARPPSNGAPAARVLAPAKRFLVLYFDDLNMTDADVIYAREAADHYLSANLQPDERVALFTSSAMLSDFTADLKQLHEALSRLHPHPRSAAHTDCPDLSDYQAEEIVEHDNPNSSDAWKVALDEAVQRCHWPNPNDPPPGVKPDVIEQMNESQMRDLARVVEDQSQMAARTDLQSLEQVVNILSKAPGERSVILVSPGFLSHSEQYQLDHIIDRALRSEVVVSSLDPRGLALLMREADVTNGYTPAANSGVPGAQHAEDTNREMVATDVLAEVAEGTGGQYFHNNNDLTAGFRALAGSEGSYILAFAPTDAKEDGKFHSLKVTVAEQHHGFSLQARRGYFALKNGMVVEDRPHLEQRPMTSPTLDAETQEKERIRQAVMSKTDEQELPLLVRTEVSKGANLDDLAVMAHLDTRALRFDKENGRNQNTVTFVAVVFDGNGKFVSGQEQHATVNLPDSDILKLNATGIDVKTVFHLEPGAYTIREVVTESEDHHITALSRSVQVQ